MRITSNNPEYFRQLESAVELPSTPAAKAKTPAAEKPNVLWLFSDQHNVYEETSRAADRVVAEAIPARRPATVSRNWLISTRRWWRCCNWSVPPTCLPEGRSLVPTLTEGKPTGRRFAFSANYSQSTVIGQRTSLASGPILARSTKRGTGAARRDQLYDRQTDPQELRNLAGTPAVAEVETELRLALSAQMK